MFNLTLPFEKYFNQMKVISKNINNKLSHLTTYSISNISRIVKDTKLFYMFVDYFKHYTVLKDFLDKSLDEIIELVKNSNKNYLSEFYQIFAHLVANGNSLKALEIYHRMKPYLDTEDFINILLPFFSRDTIIATEIKNTAFNLYENAVREKMGRSFLKNETKLFEYLKYLNDNSLIASEFTTFAYSLLSFIFSNSRLIPK
jgi:hypothetical protein